MTALESAMLLEEDWRQAELSLARCCRKSPPVMTYEAGLTAINCGNPDCYFEIALPDWSPTVAARQWNGEVAPGGRWLDCNKRRALPDPD